MESASQNNCRCSCGAVQFAVKGKPLLRVFCHCTLCQRFNKAAFSDITTFRSRDITLPADAPISFETYRPPPNVQRGKCTACDKPVVEILRVPLLSEFYMVATNNIHDDDLIMEPALHMFYEHRIADIDDGLPKYKGYWPSQLASIRHLAPALLRNRKQA